MSSEEKVEFTALVLGFCSASLSYMGFGDHQATKNLALAKQNIDIIALLQEKTRGNLTQEESTLITEALADLRAKYSEAQK
ncbi:MAG: DUF1844 domain-containing protein [Pseudobacteriovorax sp.]|nr:DUF1844 domain-containing protein [Pseudobacteriovorax sp.]